LIAIGATNFNTAGAGARERAERRIKKSKEAMKEEKGVQHDKMRGGEGSGWQLNREEAAAAAAAGLEGD
jgi:hypothetical protein